MDNNEIMIRLERATAALQVQDAYLLENNLNERTISGRLAHHLQKHFEDWHVDCEYNRMGQRAKALQLPTSGISWDDTEAKTVFPDIVVHRRGSEGPNLLVLELKKAGGNSSFDHTKLRAYQRDLGYQLAVFLEVRVGSPDSGIAQPEIVRVDA